MLALCILKDIAQPLSIVNTMVVLEPGLYANSMILVGSLIFGMLICGLDTLDDWFRVPYKKNAFFNVCQGA